MPPPPGVVLAGPARVSYRTGMRPSILVLAPAALLALTAACAHEDSTLDPADVQASRAFHRWQPGPHDSCTQEQHDAYAVVGPDGKAYPTWHPPTGPSGCSFGHEHGADPHGSNLYAETGGIPFGYASEMLAASDPAHPRDEDHVGHKIVWANGVTLTLAGDGVAARTAVCDVLLKLHQGTHSADAFTNNLHELVYHLRCDDGSEMHVTLLVAIGKPGEFARSCAPGQLVSAGSPTPSNSPAGFGVRLIPDRGCIEQFMLTPPGQASDYDAALHESWHVYNSIERADGLILAHFNPYFQVRLPSRFYDPTALAHLGRPIDVCYEMDASGEGAKGGACDSSTANGTLPRVAFDDPQSVFNGASRQVDLNEVRLSNVGGPTVWYSDALGHKASPTPFTGSIRQVISAVNRTLGVDGNGVVIGDRDYTAPGVRSPN